MNSFLEFIRTTPALVWSGLMASLLALGGVLISNASNSKRLRLQLQHDSDEKAKDRVAVMRRDVYLHAVEQLSRANSYLGSLARFDSKVSDADGIQSFLAAAAKLQLVAEPETARRINKLATAYGELTLRLMVEVAPLRRIQVELAYHAESSDRNSNEVKRILEEVGSARGPANADAGAVSRLLKQLEHCEGNLDDNAMRRAASWARYSELSLEFGRKVFEGLRTVGELQVQALVACRRDLGLPGDLDDLKREFEAQWKSMSTALESAISRLGAITSEIEDDDLGGANPTFSS